MLPADAMGRLARVLRDELAVNAEAHSGVTETRCVCGDCLADAVSAVLREIGAMADDAVMEEAIHLAHSAVIDGESSEVPVMAYEKMGLDEIERVLRAATGVLLAKEWAEVGRWKLCEQAADERYKKAVAEVVRLRCNGVERDKEAEKERDELEQRAEAAEREREEFAEAAATWNQFADERALDVARLMRERNAAEQRVRELEEALRPVAAMACCSGLVTGQTECGQCFVCRARALTRPASGDLLGFNPERAAQGEAQAKAGQFRPISDVMAEMRARVAAAAGGGNTEKTEYGCHRCTNGKEYPYVALLCSNCMGRGDDLRLPGATAERKEEG